MKFLIQLMFGVSFLMGIANAQLAIEWSTIDTGGGTSSGGDYELKGTFGQPDASESLSGGDFVVGSGFWFGIVLSEDTPDLKILKLPSGAVRVLWTDLTGNFVLQESSPPNALEEGDFTNIAGPYLEENGESYFEVPNPTGSRFFRLTKPAQ